MAIYLDVFVKIVDKLNAAKSTTLSEVKNVYEGSFDGTQSDSTPFLVVHPVDNRAEAWTALPNKRDAPLPIAIRCVVKPKQIAGLNAVRGAIRLAELVMNVLDSDPDLDDLAITTDVTLDSWENIGDNVFAMTVLATVLIRVTAGAR